jgi:hypothetical protein
MRVVIFEVCRRPEIRKENTEGTILRDCFADIGVPHRVYTNDRFWGGPPPSGTVVNLGTISDALIGDGATTVHFAVHGGTEGLVLEWSGPVDRRSPRAVLTGHDISSMTSEFGGRLVVSGACGSGALSPFFLSAGATGFVAPETEISWLNLGAFFKVFYSGLSADQDTQTSLSRARQLHPELASYRYYK